MIVLAIALLLAIFLLPNLWAQWVIKRHARGRDDYPGTGAELADHLLRRLGIEGVKVEPTDHGDHYDPEARRVRLSPEVYGGRSLTAVTVAAHEVGHAIQHHQGYAPLLAAPFLFVLTRLPGGLAIVVAAAVISFGTAAMVHLVTLPVEFDASFQRALPLLKEYIPPYDMPGARHVLTACAFTYVAASLASILNLGRWLVILRR